MPTIERRPLTEADIDATRNPKTAFLRFWAAVNDALTARGLPDLTFGPAHRLWERTLNLARGQVSESGLPALHPAARASSAARPPQGLAGLLQRIEERLTALGITAAEASRMAGLSVDAIRNLRRAVDAGNRHGISTRTLAGLANVLRTTPAWLLTGERLHLPIGDAPAGPVPIGKLAERVVDGLTVREG